MRPLKPIDQCRILVANDDGIHAPGLEVAERIARALSNDVWVVAPETEQSGASHSLTLSMPLRIRRVNERKFAVSGTPTDCVMMAVMHVMKDRPPDLVISGVNRGANIADDVTYSGTVAAAMEGTVLGIRSIALSQVFGYREDREVDWSCAEMHGAPLIRRLAALDWPDDILFNINFPDVPGPNVDYVAVTEQGKLDQTALNLDERKDARGIPYFWIGFKRTLSDPPKDTDLRAIFEGKISVTPLHLNLTALAQKKRLDALLDGPIPSGR
jgi:5'-nucleotidase